MRSLPNRLGGIFLMAVVGMGACSDSTDEAEPPQPEVVSTDGRLDWVGGFCLDLEAWQTDGRWKLQASTTFDSARQGVWGPPVEDLDLCQASGEMGEIRLPEPLSPGLYRVCHAPRALGPCVVIELRR